MFLFRKPGLVAESRDWKRAPDNATTSIFELWHDLYAVLIHGKRGTRIASSTLRVTAGCFGFVAKFWAGLWDRNVALNNGPRIHGTLMSYRDMELWTTRDLTQTARSKNRSNQTAVQDPFEDADSPTQN